MVTGPDHAHEIREALPGLLHWTTFLDTIGAHVSSYYVARAGALIDARPPAGGIDGLTARTDPTPQQAIVTSSHHAHRSGAIARHLDIPLRASREALARLGVREPPPGLNIQEYTDHDDIAPGVHAVHIDKLSDDEYALYITAVDGGAIAFADALNTYGGSMSFMPDPLLGDDPEEVKRGLVQAFEGLLLRDFEHLLFAHGDPIIGDGKRELRKFVEGRQR